MGGKDEGTERKGWFATTQWSVVLRAGSGDSGNATALATLCQTYWRPVYSYIRCRGFDADAARDLTQGFFAVLLERRGLEAARRERGRFRHFLLASVMNFLAHEREREQALKRGGGVSPVRIDADPESTFSGVLEPATHETPETIFERVWATTLLEQTMLDLQKDIERSGNVERFEKLRPYLVSDADPPYGDLAGELNMNESAVRVAQTLDDPSRVEEELRYLIGLMGT